MTTPLLFDRPGTRPAEQVSLRDYQQAALDAVLAKWRGGVGRQLVSLPTGAGKTVLAAHLIPASGLTRTVMMVHRDELVSQSVRVLSDVNPALHIGVVKADRDDVFAPVVVASAQTIAREKRLTRLQRAIGNAGLLFISDEAHHDAAPTRRNIIATLAPALLVGLTATAKRGDGLGLDGVYQEVAFHLPMLELMALGRLSPLKGLRVETGADLDAVATRGGEFVSSQLEATVNTRERNRAIVESWQRHAADRKRTVAFCVDVAHATDLRDAFREAGIAAETVLGETPPEERARIFRAFHDGELPVLTNCMVLTEGYDEPRIDCVLMCRPTKSQGLYIQCVGRAARRAPGFKDDALIVDFVDNTSRHTLVSLPTLAGRDPMDPKASGEEEEPGTEADRAAGETIDLLSLAQAKHRLRETAARKVNLFSSSAYVWQETAGVPFAVAGRARYLVLQPVGPDQYLPHVVTDSQDGAEARPLFTRPLDFEMAMSVAEQRLAAALQRSDPFDRGLAEQSAPWRDKGLRPTEKQLAYARKLGLKVDNGMSRGDVAMAIDSHHFGRIVRRLHLGGTK